MCDAKGRFLFEARPDLFPEGRLTDVEVELWSRYYDEREQQRKAVKRG